MSAARIDRVARAAIGLMTVAMAVMVLRVAQLQLAPTEELAQHVQARIARRTIAAPRGDIVDRRYRPLASTRFGYRVFVDPTELPSPPDEAITLLADALGAPADQIGDKVLSAIEKNRQRVAAAPLAATPRRSSGIAGAFSRLVAFTQRERLDGPSRPGADAGPLDGPSDDERREAEQESKKPIRYVRVSDVLDDATVERVKALRIPGVHFEQRSVRDYPTGQLAASIIGKVNVDHAGVLGAERTNHERLAGEHGRILYVRDAMGRPLWMGPGAYDPARRGEDLRLSIDLEIQRIATEELQRGVEDADAAGGRLVIMDPATGEVLAMVDLIRDIPDAVPFPWPDARPAGQRRSGLLYEPPPAIPRARYRVITPDEGRGRDPALARNRCVEDIYEPGSTFKTFVWATITELGAVRPTEVIQTHNGFWVTPYGRRIRDVHAHPQLTWENVLIQSSNIGMAQGAERLTFDQLHNAIHRFGFGSRTGVGLPGETAGKVTPRKEWSKYTQTSVSFGQEVAVTPIQMVRAFSVFARNGDLAGTLPPARIVALNPDDPEVSVVHRVLRADVVQRVRRLLRVVAADMEAKMAAKRDQPESGWRYTMFGKSGTAQIPLGKAPPGKRRPPGMGFYERQYNASFIAAGPAEEPRIVVLVVIDDPGPERVRTLTYYGSHTAGPVVRRVMERTLAYLGVPPSPSSPPLPPASTLAGLGAD